MEKWPGPISMALTDSFPLQTAPTASTTSVINCLSISYRRRKCTKPDQIF